MHPPLRCAWLGRDTSLRQSPPSRRRLSHRGGGLRSGPAPPLRPLDPLVDAGFHSGASVPLAPAREPYERSEQHLAPGGPRPIAAAVVGCNGREGPRPSPCFKSAERAAVRLATRDPPRASKARSGRRCGGARRSERQTAGRGRRREAALQGDGRYSDQAMQAAFADGCRVLRRMREREPREPHKPATPKLSADRIGWAGDAAAASRASLSRRDAWRRTRTRRQSFDCRAVRGLSQAHFGTAGEVAAASPAY